MVSFIQSNRNEGTSAFLENIPTRLPVRALLWRRRGSCSPVRAAAAGPGPAGSRCPQRAESESLESRLLRRRQLPRRSRWRQRFWVLRRRHSSDCRKDFLAFSSSMGDTPSSSTSWISSKVTGCVLKRDCRGRRSLPLGVLAGRAGGGNSSATQTKCGITAW